MRTAAGGSRARPGGSRRGRATASAGRAGRRAPGRAPRASEPRWRRPRRKTGIAPSETAAAWATSSTPGSGQAHQSGTSAATMRVEVRAEPRDLVTGETRSPPGSRRARSTTRPASGCRRRSVPSRTRAAGGPQAPPNPAANAATAAARRHATPLTRRRFPRASRAIARPAPPRLRGPRTWPGRPRRGAAPSSRSPASRRIAAASAAASPAGRAARRRRQSSSSRAAGVSAVTSGVPHASAWIRLVRDHPPGLVGRCRRRRARSRRSGSPPEAARTRSREPIRRCRPLVEHAAELARADDPERNVGKQAGRPEDRLEPVQRDQLADEEHLEHLPEAASPGLKTLILRAYEADLDPRARQLERLGEEARVLLRVRHDEICAPERDPVDSPQHPGGAASPARSRPRSPTSVSQSETSGLKTSGRPTGDATRGRHVEVPGVADDHDVERALAPDSSRVSVTATRAIAPSPSDHCVAAAPRAPRGARRPRRRRRVGRRSPARCADSRARTCRSRGRARNPAPASAEPRRRADPPARVSLESLLVVARDQLRQQAEREELDPDDDEQDAEGEQRPVADRLPGHLEHGQVGEDRDADCLRRAVRRCRRDAAAGGDNGP